MLGIYLLVYYHDYLSKIKKLMIEYGIITMNAEKIIEINDFVQNLISPRLK